MALSTVGALGLNPLKPNPGRSQAQTRVFAATAGWTLLQVMLQSPAPAVRITTGLPWPMHTRWIIRPSARRTESLALA